MAYCSGRRDSGFVIPPKVESAAQVAGLRFRSRADTFELFDVAREIGAILVLHRPRRKSAPTVTPEEMQAALARARESAVLEERNRLAGEIHDGLAQSFTAISMQLGVAKEELSSREGDPLRHIQRAGELANFGLAEARRCAHNLRSSIGHEPELVGALQRLVDRSNKHNFDCTGLIFPAGS